MAKDPAVPAAEDPRDWPLIVFNAEDVGDKEKLCSEGEADSESVPVAAEFVRIGDPRGTFAVIEPALAVEVLDRSKLEEVEDSMEVTLADPETTLLDSEATLDGSEVAKTEFDRVPLLEASLRV